MRYMLLCYDDEQAWEKAGRPALEQAMQEAVRLTHELDAKGQYRLAAPLHPSATATTVRVRDGKRLVTDGPFVETHEQLGGFYLIDAKDRDEAIAIAARHPGVFVGSVQIREVLDLAGLPPERTSKQPGEKKVHAEPQTEHHWLQKLVGDWTYESECSMGPDQPPAKFRGSETVRSIGGLWTTSEGTGEMPGGGRATTIMTLGYDPLRKKFVGTFIASMMTYLWSYEGSLDQSAKVLTLECDGPSCDGDGRIARYHDIIEFKSDDHRVMTSQMLSEDGKWRRIMEIHYHRKK